MVGVIGCGLFVGHWTGTCVPIGCSSQTMYAVFQLTVQVIWCNALLADWVIFTDGMSHDGTGWTWRGHGGTGWDKEGMDGTWRLQMEHDISGWDMASADRTWHLQMGPVTGPFA